MYLNKQLMLIEESGIRKYKQKAKELQLIDFTIGDTINDTSEEIKYAVIHDLVHNKTHYSLTQGDESVRNTISNLHQNLNYSADEVLLTIGATEGIYIALSTLLNVGDEVILFKPYYSLYKNIVLKHGGKTIEIDALRRINTEELKRKINSKTKAIILNVPSNPTGLLYLDKLDELIKLVKQNNVYLIIDATYEDIVYDGLKVDYSNLLSIKEQLIIIKSLSKSHSMTGFRLGYVLTDQSLMKHLIIMHQMCVSCIPTMFSSAYKKALSEDVADIKQEYENKRNYVISVLDETILKYIKPEGAFYVCIYVPSGLSSIKFVEELMEKASVVCVPGRCFGDERIIRLSFSGDWNQLKRGMGNIKHLYGK